MPHFLKRDVLTIPIDVEDHDVAEFLKFFKNGEIIIPDYLIQNSNSNQPEINDNSEFVFGDAGEILTILNNLNLANKEFILMYSADWADIPTDEYQAVFKDGNIIEETYYSSDKEDNNTDTYNAALRYLNITYEDVHFFSYYHNATVEYIESIFIPGPWRL